MSPTACAIVLVVSWTAPAAYRTVKEPQTLLLQHPASAPEARLALPSCRDAASAAPLCGLDDTCIGLQVSRVSEEGQSLQKAADWFRFPHKGVIETFLRFELEPPSAQQYSVTLLASTMQPSTPPPLWPAELPTSLIYLKMQARNATPLHQKTFVDKPEPIWASGFPSASFAVPPAQPTLSIPGMPTPGAQEGKRTWGLMWDRIIWYHTMIVLLAATALIWTCTLPHTKGPMQAAKVWICSVTTRLNRQVYLLALTLARLAAGMMAERSRRCLAASAGRPPSTAEKGQRRLSACQVDDTEPCATLSGFATLVFYFTGAAMLEGPQPFAERFLLCRPAFWWSLAAVALCVLLGRLGHLLLRAFPEEQPPAAASSAEPAAPSEPAVRAKPAASSQPVTGERAVRAEAPASAAEQQLLRPAHHRAAATQPSATCGAAPRTGTTSRRLIVHRRAGAMCTFDFVTEGPVKTKAKQAGKKVQAFFKKVAKKATAAKGKLSACFRRQAQRGEDESYTPLVLGPARYLDSVPELDEQKAIMIG